MFILFVKKNVPYNEQYLQNYVFNSKKKKFKIVK